MIVASVVTKAVLQGNYSVGNFVKALVSMINILKELQACAHSLKIHVHLRIYV